MKRIISIFAFAGLFLLPLSCKKDGDLMEDKPPIESGSLTGEVILPAGVSAEGLSVVTSFGEFEVQDRKFAIANADPDTYRQLFLGDKSGNVLLMAIQFPGQKQIKLDAASTADAMLMLNPVVSALDADSRNRLLREYQKQPDYAKLVTLLTGTISAGKSPLDPANDEVVDAINTIHRLGVEKGGRKGLRTSGLISDDDIIEKRIVDGKRLGLKNKRSGITYMAAAFDQNGYIVSDVLNLGELRTENTSITDLFSDTYTYITNFGECNDEFGTKEVPAFCNKFFQNSFPQEAFVDFKTPGTYKVRVANPLASDKEKDLARAATLRTLELAVMEFIGMTDIKFFSKFLHSNCYKKAAGEIADEGLKKFLLLGTKYDVKKVAGIISELIQDLMSKSGKCYIEEAATTVIDKKWLGYLEKVMIAVKRLDAFSMVGTAVNTIHVANGILHHKEFYEFCVKFDGTELRFCEELVETIGAAAITSSSATLQGRINFLNNENIVRFGFLVGGDPAKMQSTASLIKNVAQIPGGLKVPYPFEMSFAYQGKDKIYYQAFAENELGIVHRGQIMEFIPEQEGSNAIAQAVVGKGVGDPHLTTFDGRTFGFMAAGEFIATKSTIAGDKFEVQVRQQEIKSKNNDGVASFNTAIAIHTGNDKISVTPDKKIYINDKLTSVGTEGRELQNGGMINIVGSFVYVQTPAGDRVEIQLFGQDLDYFIWPNPNRKGKLRGLQGNFDGNAANDLATANGQQADQSYEGLYKLFAPGWRVTQGSSLFTYASGTSTATYTDATYPKKLVTITNEQRTRAKTICEKAGVTDPDVLENCVEDVALTGEIAYAERAQASEKREMISSLSIADFGKSSHLFEIRNSSIIGSDWVPNEDEGARLDLNADFFVNDAFESQLSFTLKDVYASGPSIGMFGNVNANGQLGLSLVADVYGLDFQVGRWFYGSADLDVKLLDGEKHTLRTILRQKRVPQGYECNLEIFLDGASKPVIIKADPQVNRFFSDVLRMTLVSNAVTVHSWTLKAL